MPLDRIVTAAMAIVDEQGADALSLRAVATRLGSSTATLYRHLRGRTELVGLVLDRTIGEIELDEDTLLAADWQEACRHLTTALFEALARHQHIALLLTEQIPAGPNSLAYRERAVTVLLAGGFKPEIAAHAAVSLARYALGFAMQVRGEDRGTLSADSTSRPKPDPEAYPGIAAIAKFLPTQLHEEFRFGLDLMLAGLSGPTSDPTGDR